MDTLIFSPNTSTAQDNTHTLDREMAEQDSMSHFSHPDHEHKRESESREMAQQDTITISHFSHPGHELLKQHYMGPSFLCDMCWEGLSGPAYGCLAGCDFCIHESCASHPQTLSSPKYHAHPLVLVQTRRDAALVCDICAGSCAPGSFLYRCPPCGFDMHPSCARLPQVVRSSRHSEHGLTLVVDEGSCAACHNHHGEGSAWYYRCTACNVDFHVSCAATSRDNKSRAHQARHDGNSHVQQQEQASAAQIQAVARDRQRDLQVAHLRAKLELQALDNASEYVSYPGSRVRKEYYYI